MAGEHALLTPLAARLADAFWPGPLTLVLTRGAHSPLSQLASAGLESIAIRVPDHPVAQALLRIMVPRPTATLSERVLANSGMRPSKTCGSSS